MNIDGTYKLTLDTPLGNQDGTLTLKTKGAELSGTLVNERGTTEFSGGTVSGETVQFKTKIPTPIGRLKAHVTGRLTADHFTGNAKLPLGSAHIEGVRA
ncbi:MAG: hypothetical protein PVJ33_06895 [Lysobacterales bacterium]|jgi:hypothetical protein